MRVQLGQSHLGKTINADCKKGRSFWGADISICVILIALELREHNFISILLEFIIAEVMVLYRDRKSVV